MGGSSSGVTIAVLFQVSVVCDGSHQERCAQRLVALLSVVAHARWISMKSKVKEVPQQYGVSTKETQL